MSVFNAIQRAALDVDVLAALRAAGAPSIKDLTAQVARALLARREPWAVGAARDRRLHLFVRTALVRLEARGAVTCVAGGRYFQWTAVAP